MNNLYVKVNEEKTGPYTLDELKNRIATGQFIGSEKGWYEGLSEWQPISEIIEPKKANIKEPSSYPSTNIYVSRDGQNYGPYSMGQINNFLAAGTFQNSDWAFCEGSTDWVPLSSIKGVLRPAPKMSAPQITDNQINPISLKAGICVSAKRSFTFGQYFKTGWAELRKKISWDIGAGVLALLLFGILSQIQNLIVQVALPIFTPLIFGCPIYLFVRKARGVMLSRNDFFTGFIRRPFSLLAFGLLIDLPFLIIISTLGHGSNNMNIFLASFINCACWFFTQFSMVLMVDKNVGLLPALMASLRAVFSYFPVIFVFSIVSGMFAILGLLAMGVGFLVTGAISGYAWIYLYLDLFDSESLPKPTE